MLQERKCTHSFCSATCKHAASQQPVHSSRNMAGKTLRQALISPPPAPAMAKLHLGDSKSALPMDSPSLLQTPSNEKVRKPKVLVHFPS